MIISKELFNLVPLCLPMLMLEIVEVWVQELVLMRVRMTFLISLIHHYNNLVEDGLKCLRFPLRLTRFPLNFRLLEDCPQFLRSPLNRKRVKGGPQCLGFPLNHRPLEDNTQSLRLPLNLRAFQVWTQKWHRLVLLGVGETTIRMLRWKKKQSPAKKMVSTHCISLTPVHNFYFVYNLSSCAPALQ